MIHKDKEESWNDKVGGKGNKRVGSSSAIGKNGKIQSDCNTREIREEKLVQEKEDHHLPLDSNITDRFMKETS